LPMVLASVEERSVGAGVSRMEARKGWRWGWDNGSHARATDVFVSTSALYARTRPSKRPSKREHPRPTEVKDLLRREQSGLRDRLISDNQEVRSVLEQLNETSQAPRKRFIEYWSFCGHPPAVSRGTAAGYVEW
jgi:hypothetical protein